MMMTKRHKQILEILKFSGNADVETLVQILGVSEPTVRRDLTALENKGCLIRTFGGAQRLPEKSLVANFFGDRLSRMWEEKLWIARAAVAMVKPGMIVALDNGSTVQYVASALREKGPLTVITMGLAPIEELGADKNITIHMIGGRFHLNNLAFVGPATIDEFKKHKADVAFIGMDSYIPHKGAFTPDRMGSEIALALAECANQRVCVCDHTKFNNHARYLALNPAHIDTLITDAGTASEIREQLDKEPFDVIYASDVKEAGEHLQMEA